ncbi:MAG: NADH-quinone oxidoreductase subunit D [Candidatus Nanopelagicales bacterium]
MEETTVGTGLAPADLTLDLGDLHPSGHGALRIACRTEGDRVVAATPEPGLLHRGTEKLLEARDYRQALMLANRHDWLGAAVSEIALAVAIEELLGIEVPPRAVWLRTLLCEISRASAALLLLAGAATLPPRGTPGKPDRGGFAGPPGKPDRGGFAGPPGIAAREAWLDCLEGISGGRVHPMIARVGGLAHDAPADWGARISDAIITTQDQMPAIREAIDVTIPEGIAVLSTEEATRWAVGGPVARASGLDEDLRRDAPTLAYAEVADAIAVACSRDGDARARYHVLADQVIADLDVIAALWSRVPGGDIDVRLPKVVRAPEGEAYSCLESAMGPSGAFVVSTGETTPWRVRLRTASYANVQAMGAALPGTRLVDLPAAVGSFLFVAGDLDH